VVEQPLLAAPWDWGRTVMTGAMAEHQELQAIRGQISSLEEQLAEMKLWTEGEMAKTMQQLEEEVNVATKQAYKKGRRDGSVIWAIIGLGFGVLIAD